MILEILINRLHIIPISYDINYNIDKKKKLMFLLELANLGYKINNVEIYNDSVLKNYKNIINILKKIKGDNVDYVPLFQGFPNETPDDQEYLTKRLIGYIGNFMSIFKKGNKLDTGIIIPEWLFDLKEFGADPITQFQDINLFKNGVNNQNKRKSDENTVWIDLELVSDNEAIKRLKDFLKNNLYSKSSIKEVLKNDIEFLLNYFNLDFINPQKVVFKETKTYLMKFFYQKNDFVSLELYINTTTDLLRLFASLTNSDISLAKKIKFPKFSKKQRRFILKSIENTSNIAENLNTYKYLWLEIARYLHVGEYKNKYPKTFKAFDTLRNKKVYNFNSKIESLIKEIISNKKDKKEILDNLLNLLIKKPGIFARKLHHILEISETNYKKVLNSFQQVSQQIELKNLLIMKTYFSTIEDLEYRTIINKKGKIKIIENQKHRLNEETIVLLLEIIESSIILKISQEKETWKDKKIYIDENLINYTIPLQQRKASDGLLTLGRGSRIPIDLSKTLRLFVYWKQTELRTDLDLSVIKFDENMKYIGHVSYTNLKMGGIIHSGDIQSAPHGASEFVDIDMSYLKKNMKDTRYLVVQIYRYSGEKFSQMTAYSGWMIRKNVNRNYKSFDIKTIENKFDLIGSSSYSIPILVDLLEEKIIFVDIYVKAMKYHNNVEGALDDISIISREIARMIETKPNMLDLVKYNAIARNATIIDDINEADISFGIKNCDYNVNNIDKILSELI